MKTFIVLLVLFILYMILKPSIDYDKPNKQIIIWYGRDYNRKPFIIPLKKI